MKLRYLLTSLFVAGSCLQAAPPTPDQVMTIIRPRSQELNRPLQMVGVCESTHILDKGPFYATLSAAGFYNKAFKTEKITCALFGKSLQCSNNCSPYLHIQGSSYLGANRDPKALFADYFYLPIDYDGKVSFNPSIKNCGADIDLYFGLNNIKEGAYLRIHSTLVNSRWDLRVCESITDAGSMPYPAGYFTPNYLNSNQLLSSFKQYGCGEAPLGGVVTQNTAQIAFDLTDGNTSDVSGYLTTHLDGLAFSKICCAESKTRLADIRFELGKIIKETEDYHIGADLQVLVPTGTRIRSHYLLEPTIGNGHHWELGGGLHGHYRFYNKAEKEAEAAFYSDFTLTHLFKTQQKRTFDLKNKPLSRYMLASHFTAGSSIFEGQYAPVANISTLDLNVSVAVQIDFSVLFHYNKKKWDFDLGYNLWYRSREKLSCLPSCPQSICDPMQHNRWALKGDARMYAYGYNSDSALWTSVTPIAATEHDATIYAGTDNVSLNCSATDINASIDNPVQSSVNALVWIVSCPDGDDAANLMNISTPPIFIQCADLDIQGIKSLSHKIFANSSYQWDRHDLEPFIGIGGSAEFGQINVRSTFFAPSSWEVWLKTGITFE